jgi:hypothetical protein
MPDGHKIDQMAIKYTNIFHPNILQNLYKLVVLVCKHAIYNICTIKTSRPKLFLVYYK